RRIFAQLGPFDLRYRTLADWEFNYRVFADEKLKTEYVDEIIARYAGKGASMDDPDPQFWADRDRLYERSFGKEKLTEALRAEVKRLGGEVNRVKSTASWQVTKPLRLVANLWRAIRQRVGT